MPSSSKNCSETKINDIASFEVSTQQLAVILGLTTRRIQQLSQDGIINTSKRGRFLLVKAIQSYISSLKTEEFSRDDKKVKSDKLKAEADWKAAKARVAEAEANELEGKMHRSEDVRKMTEDLILTIKSALIALPGRLAIDVSEKSSSEASVIIRAAVYDILTELSKYSYNPAAYEDRVRERKKMEINILNDEFDNEQY